MTKHYPIHRTRFRDVPLILTADHLDAGPYYLIDRAGYGVSWRKPAIETRPTGEQSRSIYRGNPSTRKVTAFTIVNEDDEVSAKEAKKIADTTYARLGNSASPSEAERFAWHLVEKMLGTRT